MGTFPPLLCLFTMATVQAKHCTDKACEYYFHLSWKLTMTYVDEMTGKEYDVEMLNDGRAYLAGGGFVQQEEIIIGDGTKREVITVNGEFPGPTIEVNEGAQIVVHVVNDLGTATSIHWHGMFQNNTQWMDGVAHVTQCPIPAASNFTYNFTALPGGTHWYHSHALNQRDDGLYGLMIVHRWNMKGFPVAMILSQLFGFTGDKILKEAAEIDELERHKKHAADHGDLLPFEQHNVLINGRGRDNPSDHSIPWTQIPVAKGKGYVLHVVHAGADHAFKVSIDNHEMYVLAIDGFEIEPTQADKFLIYPGESLDIGFVANPQRASSSGTYWIRVSEIALHESKSGHMHKAGDDDGDHSGAGQVHDRSKRVMDGDEAMMEHAIMEGRAVIVYDSQDPVVEPTSTGHDCNEHPCKVFNCPGPADGGGEKCILLHQVKGSDVTNAEIWKKLRLADEPDYTYVLNFILSGKPNATGSSVNGKKFVLPPEPMYGVNSRTKDCSRSADPHCTNILTLPANKVVQLTFANIQGTQPIYMHHPIHLHGHVFAVTKVAYPTFDPATQTFHKPAGIVCEDKYCEHVVRFQDEGRRRRHAPEFHGLEVPLKSTVLVPARGYVDVRIFTGNPGFWFAHCHVSQHLVDGMAVLIGVLPQISPPPPGFPACNNTYMEYLPDSSRAIQKNVITGQGSRTETSTKLSFILLLIGLSYT